MWTILSLWVKNSPTRIFREVYRRIIIAIIREEGHFLRSYIYGWFTEVIFTNIKDQDELFKPSNFWMITYDRIHGRARKKRRNIIFYQFC